jgi:hypothetical protein
LNQLDFDQVIVALKASAWAVARGTPADLRGLLKHASASWVETEASGATARLSATLRPSPEVSARPKTLSAQYGLRAQPLHSDGADLHAPPQIIVLYSAKPSATSTVVYPIPRVYGDHMRSGLFTVSGREGKFLSPAMKEFVRFDPGCMSASDHLAHKVVADFAAARKAAYKHHWTEPDLLLFIDNHRALHAREAVKAGDANRVLIRMAFYANATA